MGLPYSGKQDPQIVIYLRYRADCGPGVSIRSSLFNSNGRRQPFNGIHIRFFHLLKELTGVGGQRFHIPPLPFGIDGIKGQGRLAGA